VLALDVRLTEATAQMPRCIKPSHWPPRDQTAWAAAHRPGGLLEDDGLAASWAPATSDIIARGYGTYLAYLAETGDLDPTASPSERVTRPRIESYLAYLRERNHRSCPHSSAHPRDRCHEPDGGFDLAAPDLCATAPISNASARRSSAACPCRNIVRSGNIAYATCRDRD